MIRLSIRIILSLSVVGMAYWLISMISSDFLKEFAKSPGVVETVPLLMWVGFALGAIVVMALAPLASVRKANVQAGYASK